MKWGVTMDKELARKAHSNGGSAVSGVSGGQKKQKYYTSSGEVVYKAPSLREWIIRDSDGKVCDSGTRDVNYDNGLLDRMPEVLKFKCKVCKAGHDTQEECDDHVEKNRAFVKKFEKAQTDERADILEAKVDRLESMFEQILTALGGQDNGPVVQREQDAAEEDRGRGREEEGTARGRIEGSTE